MHEGQVTITSTLLKKILRDRAKKHTLWLVLARKTLISVSLYLGLVSASIMTDNDIFKNPIWLLAIWLGFVTFSVHKLYKQIASINEGYSFHVVLNEDGVILNNQIVQNLGTVSSEQKLPWEAYKYYVEHEDYLEIHCIDKTISYLPKSDDLSGIIKFTKTHIKKLG